MNAKVYCLHGFLGLPSDWDFLDAPKEASLQKVDIFKVLSPSTGASMMDWAEAFNDQLSKNSEKRVLLGYSMGGRLALHSLVRNPSLFAGAVIVSANPSPLPEERKSRIAADETWAERFENEPWESVVSAWESHPVFGGKPIPFLRRESDLRRADLAGALRAWSLAHQESLTPRLSQIEVPVLWITGEQDSRYQEIAKRVRSQTAGAPIEFVSIPDSGHRVPWEQTEAFETHFSSFLRRVFC
jgi:2-succinyl-6-hydroxy-2,4-cyclohexadiene-1-carboxylate synthase